MICWFGFTRVSVHFTTRENGSYSPRGTVTKSPVFQDSSHILSGAETKMFLRSSAGLTVVGMAGVTLRLQQNRKMH